MGTKERMQMLRGKDLKKKKTFKTNAKQMSTQWNLTESVNIFNDYFLNS